LFSCSCFLVLLLCCLEMGLVIFCFFFSTGERGEKTEIGGEEEVVVVVVEEEEEEGGDENPGG